MKAADGILLGSPVYSANISANMQAFLEKYKETYGMDASQFSVLGYDAMKMLAQAITEAGSTDSAAVTEALAGIDFTGLTGHMTFDADGEPQKDAKVAKIVNGQYVAQ